MKKLIFAICAALLCLDAAGRSISGTVRDSRGEAIPGAAVIVDGGGNVGVVTDMDGRYVLTVPDAGKVSLTFSCLSYKSQTVATGTRTVMDVVLQDDAEALDEAVVVGYGAMRRSDLTGSVTSVRIDDNASMKSATLDKMLEGRAAGVQVLSGSGSPDAGVSIRIRGIASFSGNTDPLYVVDGVIVNGSAQSVSTMTVGTSYNAVESTNGLAGINSQDIASIEVLKDASATAIYGSQGANGVVLITTKQARKDVPTVSYNTGFSVSNTDKRLDLLTFDDYCDMLAAYPIANAQKQLATIYTDPDARTGLKVTPIDWQDYIFRTAYSQRYYLSVSGKPGGFNYLFSIGFNRDEGIIRSSDSDNLTARLNLEKKVTDFFTVRYKMNFGYTKSNLVTGAVSGGNITSRSSLLRSAMRSRPYLVIGEDNPEEEFDESMDEDYNFGPSRWLDGTTNTSERFRINPSLCGEFRIAKWLTFRSLAGADINTNERIKSKTAKLSVGYGNLAGIGQGFYLSYNWDNSFNFWKRWGRHTLSGAVGESFYNTIRDEQSVTGWFLPQANARELDINNATSISSQYEQYSRYNSAILSFFGRAIYNYDERYILTSTFRFDGSSRFKGANKWGTFPSFAFAWRPTSEKWFHVPFVSNAKIRLGWGEVGNQSINNYQTSVTYGTTVLGDHFNDSGKVIGSVPGNIANENLKWETSVQWNAGLDLSLWKGRLALTVDAYVKNTRDLLQNKSVPLSTGYTTVAINDGAIRNKGLEITLDTVPFKYGDFEIGLGGNISWNRNTILSVGAGGSTSSIFLSASDTEKTPVKYFYGAALQSSGDTNPLNIFIEGQSMGLFYGYVFDGIVQAGETAPGFTQGTVRTEGYCKYKDLDGNGYIDENDRTVIGDPLPDFTYGFNLSFDWKRLSLSVDFNGVSGADIFNLNNVQDYQNTYEKNMRYKAYAEAWSPTNPSNEWPALSCGTDVQLSDRYVEDGSYFRISNVALSYSFPFKKSTKVLHGLSLSASAGNVWIWTRYSGYTPISSSYGSSVQRLGVEINSGPYPRSYSLDLKFTF